MRLSWNEVRARAAEFARQWQGEGYERGQTQLFYQAFFDIFGISVRRVASFEEPVRLLGDKRGFIDLFWKGVLLVEQKSAGRDLRQAKTQALDYFPGLKESELPRYLLLSDFQSFELYDLDEDDEIRFKLADLALHVERFGFIMGVQRRTFRDQDPVNIEASELIGQIYDSVKEGGHPSPDIEQIMVRLVFCLFADDTGIFQPRGIFQDYLENRTLPDGTDLGNRFGQICQVLNIPEGLSTAGDGRGSCPISVCGWRPVLTIDPDSIFRSQQPGTPTSGVPIRLVADLTGDLRIAVPVGHGQAATAGSRRTLHYRAEHPKGNRTSVHG